MKFAHLIARPMPRRGLVVTRFEITSVISIGFAALAVNFGILFPVRSDSHNAADRVLATKSSVSACRNLPAAGRACAITVGSQTL